MAIVVGWLGSVASIAQGQPDAATEEEVNGGATALHWVRLAGAYDCIGGHVLARSIEAKLRRPIFSASRSFPLLIEGHVARAEDGYHAVLRMTAHDGTLLGTRTLNSQAADCRELSETVSVVLAVMIDPEASIQTTTPVAPPPPEPAKTPAPAVPAPAEEPAQTLLAFTRAGVKLNPTLAIGFGLAYERGFPRLGGVRAEAIAFLEDRSADRPGVALRLAYAGIGYCPLWFDTRAVRMSGCAGAELGIRQSEGLGFGPDQGEKAITLWASASARASLAFRVVSTVMVLAGAGFFVPIVSQEYVAKTIAGKQDVFRQSPLGAIFDLGIGARF